MNNQITTRRRNGIVDMSLALIAIGYGLNESRFAFNYFV